MEDFNVTRWGTRESSGASFGESSIVPEVHNQNKRIKGILSRMHEIESTLLPKGCFTRLLQKRSQTAKKLDKELASLNLQLSAAKIEMNLFESAVGKKEKSSAEKDQTTTKRLRSEQHVSRQVEESVKQKANDVSLLSNLSSITSDFSAGLREHNRDRETNAYIDALETIQRMNNINNKDKNGNTALHLACSANMSDLVTVLLAMGADPNETNLYGMTPLMNACRNGDVRCAELLLESPEVNRETIDLSRKTAMDHAIESGDNNTISLMKNIRIRKRQHDEGEQLNAKRSRGETAVQEMSDDEQEQNVEQLISNFSNAIRKIKENAAFPEIAKSANLEALKIAQEIQEISDINHKDKNGNTLLHLACESGIPDVVTLLLLMGADIELVNNKGMTPLMVAVENKNLNIANTILDKTEGSIPKFMHGNTALHLLVTPPLGNENELLSLLTKLLEKFPELINEDNIEGVTPLMIACRNGNIECIEFLLESGKIDVDMVDMYSNNALHYAIESKDPQTIENLLRHFPHIANDIPLDQILDNDGNTIAYYAFKVGNINIIDKSIRDDKTALFVPNRFGITPFHQAVLSGQHYDNSTYLKYLLNITEELLLNDADLYDDSINITQEIQKLTPELKNLLLSKAVEHDCSANRAAIALIKAGADCNIPCDYKDFQGATAFMIALSNSKMRDTVDIMLVNADMNVTSHGLTPLHFASWGGHIDLVTQLINNGFDPFTKVNMKEHSGINILMIAAINGNAEMLNILIDRYGLDALAERSDEGLTVLDYAIKHKKTNIIHALLDSDAPYGNNIENLNYFISCRSNKNLTKAVLSTLQNRIQSMIYSNLELINAQDAEGDTPLLLAMQSPKENKELIDELLSIVKIDLTIKNKKGQSVIDLAILNGFTYMAIDLLNKGPISIAPTPENLTFCIRNFNQFRSSEIISKIVEENPELINKKLINGNTPLSFALKNNPLDPKLIKLLLDNGADPLIKDSQGYSPWSRLCELDFNKEDIYLLINSFINSPMGKLHDVINSPIDYFDIINFTYKNNGTFLIKIAQANNAEKFKELIAKGANPFKTDTDGNSAISILAQKNNPSIVEILRTLDIKEAKPNCDGDTLLHIASKKGNIELMGYLIEHGMSISEKNRYNETPLQCLLHSYFTAKLVNDDIALNKLTRELARDRAQINKVLNEKKELLKTAVGSGEKELHALEAAVEKAQNTLDVVEGSLEDLRIASKRFKHFTQNGDSISLFISQLFGSEFRILNTPEETLSGASIDQMVERMLAHNNNPLDLALALNNVQISRQIAKKLGPEQFKECLKEISKKSAVIANSFEETLKYDIDYRHLGVKPPEIPTMDKEERDHYVSLIPSIFKELMKEDEERFRNFIPDDKDKNIHSDSLEERLNVFISRSANNFPYMGFPRDLDERQRFYDKLLNAAAHTVKYLLEYKGDDPFNTKAVVISDYLDMISQCGPRLKDEFERIYFSSAKHGTDHFEAGVYNHLLELRSNIVRSIIPEDPQKIHYNQVMRKRVAEYNVGISRMERDPYSKQRDNMEILDINGSFLATYHSAIVNSIKDLLKGNLDTFDTWCASNGAALPQNYVAAIEKIARGESITEQDKVPSTFEKDIKAMLDEIGLDMDDLNDESVRNNMLETYFGKDWKISFLLEKLGILKPVDIFS